MPLTSGAGDFTLTAELGPHDQIVRCVASIPATQEVLTGSRDRLVRKFTPGAVAGSGQEGKEDQMEVDTGVVYTETQCAAGAEHWIDSLAAPLRDSTSAGTILYAAGSHDGVIRVYSAADGSEVKQLRGHDGPVSSLAVDSNGKLVSGGWDGTARWVDRRVGVSFDSTCSTLDAPAAR